jgi:trans-aconitate 2-methyltransferase
VTFYGIADKTGKGQPSMKTDWAPELYHRFADERARPAHELLARVPLEAPETVVDIGCGSGLSTAPLVARWPAAHVTGLDSSPAMLKKAAAELPGVAFVEADVSTWAPQAPVDLLFSNAALQWVPDHATLLPRLVSFLRPGGVFAYQVPVNMGEPSHVAMREAGAAVPFAAKLTQAVKAREPMHSAEAVWDMLSPHVRALDIWDTIYQHVMPDHQAIVEWVKATGLRPWLDPLDAGEQAIYLATYLERLKAQYGVRVDGKVLLAFPRRFVVAVR